MLYFLYQNVVEYTFHNLAQISHPMLTKLSISNVNKFLKESQQWTYYLRVASQILFIEFYSSYFSISFLFLNLYSTNSRIINLPSKKQPCFQLCFSLSHLSHFNPRHICFSLVLFPCLLISILNSFLMLGELTINYIRGMIPKYSYLDSQKFA